MKLKILFLLFVVCTSYLMADSAELPTVKMKIHTYCGARDGEYPFEYKTYRDYIVFAIKDNNHLSGIMPYGENPNIKNLNYFYHTSDDAIKILNSIDTLKKVDYSYVPTVNYFIENKDKSVQINKLSFQHITIEPNTNNTNKGDVILSSFDFNSGVLFGDRMLSNNDVKFVVKYDLLDGKVKKVKKEVHQFGNEMKLINGEIKFVSPHKKFIEIDVIEETKTPFVKEYKVELEDNAWDIAKENCEYFIEEDIKQIRLNGFGIVLIILSVIGIICFFTYKLFKKIKNTAKHIQIRAHEYKVQKIAEDEAIRATVKKAIDEDSEDSKELQELINKAVAKGDTETAQSLLAILERRKKS